MLSSRTPASKFGWALPSKRMSTAKTNEKKRGRISRKSRIPTNTVQFTLPDDTLMVRRSPDQCLGDGNFRSSAATSFPEIEELSHVQVGFGLNSKRPRVGELESW